MTSQKLRFGFLVRVAAIAAIFAIPLSFWTFAKAHDFARAQEAIGIELHGSACLADAEGLLRAVQTFEPVARDAYRPLDRAQRRLQARGCMVDAAPWAARRAELHRKVLDPNERRKLAAALIGTFNTIGDRSNLTYDPHATILNLGDVVAYSLPQVQENLLEAGAANSRVRAAKLHAVAMAGFATMEYDVKAATSGRADLEAPLAEPVRKALASGRNYSAELDAWENGPTDRHVRQPALLAAMRSATHDAALVFGAVNAALARELATELSTIRDRMPMFWSAYFGELALATFLAWAIAATMLHRERGALLRLREEAARLQAEVARDRVQFELGIREARFQAVFAGSPLAIAITDRNGSIVESNEAYMRFAGCTVSGDRRELFHGLTVEPHDALAQIFSNFRTSGSLDTQQVDLLITHRDQRRVWCHAVVSTVRESTGPPVHFSVMLADITERKDRERHFQHEATHDFLTGLPNRAFAVATLQRHLQLETAEGPRFAVLFIDVDDFKSINDTLGHRAGDECLKAVADRLSSLVRDVDIVTRYGGDEFIILLTDPSSVSNSRDIAGRIAIAFSAPLAVGGAAVTLFLSVGLMVDRHSHESAEQVLREADSAMYGNKLGGEKRLTKIELLPDVA